MGAGAAVMILMTIVAIGLVTYGAYVQYSIAKTAKTGDKSGGDDVKSMMDKCKAYPSGIANYMQYNVVPMPNKELRDDGYILKGRTKELGIPYYCKPRPPTDKSDKAGECSDEHERIYFVGDENDDLVMPDNWSDNPSAFSDYYFKPDSTGKVNGINPDEAALECFRDKGCGTVYLPSCEIGYKFVSKKTLNKLVGDDDSITDKSSGWTESSDIFENGKFKNHACVKIDRAGAAKQKGKSPNEVDADWKSFLDFSDVKTLNMKSNPSKSESPARMAYFYKKSHATSSSATGVGASAKQKSENDGGDYNLLEGDTGNSRSSDAVMIQYWSGNSGTTYEEVPEKDTPCETVNAMTNKDDREKCETLIPGWSQQNCSVRKGLKRAVGKVSVGEASEVSM